MNHANHILEAVNGWLSFPGMSVSWQHFMTTAAVVCMALALSTAIYYLCTRVLAPMVRRFVVGTKAEWDDILLSAPMVRALSYFIVVMELVYTLPSSLDYYPSLRSFASVVLRVSVVFCVAVILNKAITALYDIVSRHKNFPGHSLRGLREMLQIIVVCVALIVAVSILIGRSPLIVLSGLGASAAVLMLIFKDSILGLVAGVRLTMNDMLRPGDWITAPKAGANGIVLEVSLSTVKVQNFDMTIVTIPPYSLVSDSFQNWRGMQESGGRRIARSFCIDVNSVRFLTPGELAQYKDERWAADIDLSRRQVNLSVFRRYLENYISNVASAVRDMMVMVRELQPTPQGIPVEIYFFTSRQEWLEYEHVQADLLDFVLASVPSFGLRVYQAPSGLDLQDLRTTALKVAE